MTPDLLNEPYWATAHALAWLCFRDPRADLFESGPAYRPAAQGGDEAPLEPTARSALMVLAVAEALVEPNARHMTLPEAIGALRRACRAGDLKPAGLLNGERSVPAREAWIDAVLCDSDAQFGIDVRACGDVWRDMRFDRAEVIKLWPDPAAAAPEPVLETALPPAPVVAAPSKGKGGRKRRWADHASRALRKIHKEKPDLFLSGSNYELAREVRRIWDYPRDKLSPNSRDTLERGVREIKERIIAEDNAAGIPPHFGTTTQALPGR